uniref:PLA2c domain-containing protein n=1 Tax=Oncorhynchus mykiss TaxID=8022 RepID=A0A8K9WXZ7_ONCMY
FDLSVSLCVSVSLCLSLSHCVSPPEDVPNIALLGSGGGERAAVGMLGSLHQLKKDDMLGSLLYMCGVSGTTWCMSSLYSDPDWSLNNRCVEVIKKMKGPMVDLKKVVDWLIMREDSDQDFSLTDFWGVFTACYFMNEVSVWFMCVCLHVCLCLSVCLYVSFSASVEQFSPTVLTVGVWFEMTPHESGFSGLGAFVPTSCLRSRFKGRTLIEKRKEMDMVLLQGICGSAFADTKENIAEVAKKIWGLFEGKPQCIALVSLQGKYSIFWIVLIFFLLLIEWKWGTTSNFLFKIKDARVPESMASNEKIHLVDAALKINSPYPPVLRTSRKVDLIISLDFSEDPFETVFSAKKYADELKLPFPPVNEDIRKEKDHPQDCYVFEGRRPEEPTIMHMPLFNLRNCHGVW